MATNQVNERSDNELTLDDKIMDFRYADDVKIIYQYSEKQKADVEIRSIIRQLKEGIPIVHQYVMDNYTKITRKFLYRHFKIELLPQNVYVLLKK